MKKWIPLLAAAACVLLVMCGCTMVIPEEKRVTFALVIDDPTYEGVAVIADVHVHDGDGEMLETVQDAFEPYPASSHYWARMTTLETIPTNCRYHLVFFFDMNDDGSKNAGDKEGQQHFEVTPNAVWSETKYFVGDLTDVP